MHKVGLGRHGQASPVGHDQPHAPAAQRPGERQLGHPLRQRHDRGQGQGRRAADEDVDPQRLAAPDRRRVVDADAAMNLVVQADLAIELVLVAGKLHAIHAEVRCAPAGPVGILGVDLRQRDERPAVHAATTGSRAADRWSSGDPGSGRGTTILGLRCQSVRGAEQQRQMPGRPGGSILSSTSRRTESSVSRNRNRARSMVPNRLLTIGECSSLDPPEQERRPTRLVDPAPGWPRFPDGDRPRVDDHQTTCGVQVGNAVGKRAIAHSGGSSIRAIRSQPS